MRIGSASRKCFFRFAVVAASIALYALPNVSAAQDRLFVDNVGQSLINRSSAQLGGWAWKSVIQAPNYQTDRDVGAASVGTAFLQMYDATGETNYLNAAAQAGQWLIATQTSAGWWPDHDNPGKGAANYGYTSLDDGVAGQASFLLDLYQKTNNVSYQNAALKGINWLLSVAKAPTGSSCPSQQCYWEWAQPSTGQVYLGMGSGVAGIFYSLDRIAQITANATYEKYALAAAAFEETQIAANGAVPEAPSGNVANDTGLYQGGAGVALAYYSLYQHTGDTRWFNDANKIMAWVRSKGIAQTRGTAWPVSAGTNANKTISTEIAEGAAGIGWAELQAYQLTHAAIDLQTAEAAANWLLSVQTKQSSGVAWPAYMSGADANDYYTSEDLGTAGIGYFFNDLYLATDNAAYNVAAQNAMTWLQAIAIRDSSGYGWYQHNCAGCGGWLNYAEPSFNWGMAGIGAFAARLNGGSDDMPRDIDALNGDVYAIGAGQKNAQGAYTVDSYSSGASMGTDSVSHAIDLSAVTFQKPAPLAIYQGERYGSNFTYTVPNLIPGQPYTVRLHFAETVYTSKGKREFNVLINGTQVLKNFDIVAAAGAGFKATIQTFTAVASTTGSIRIQFTQGAADLPKVSGIEIN